MRAKGTIGLVLVAAAALLVVGCQRREGGTTYGETATPRTETGREAGAAPAVPQESVAQQALDSFKRTMDTRLNDLDTNIDGVESQLKDRPQATRRQFDAQLQDIKNRRDGVRNTLRDLKSDTNWQNMQQDLTNRVSALEKQVQDLRTKVESLPGKR